MSPLEENRNHATRNHVLLEHAVSLALVQEAGADRREVNRAEIVRQGRLRHVEPRGDMALNL